MNHQTNSNGELSAGWPRVPLGDVCQIIAKQVDPKLPEFACLPHVNGENIESGTRRLHGVRSAAEDGMTSGKYLFEPGDVLYSKLRPYLRKVVPVDFRGLCSADACPIRVNPERLDVDYLAWALLSDDFTEYADAESRRARMPKLNREQLFAWNIPLPPLAEQRRIAGRLREQLAEVAKARTAVQAQLAAAQALPAAALREVFDCLESSDWPRCRIGEVGRVQSGYAFKSEWYSTDGIRLLRNANVSQGRISWDDTARILWERRSEFPSVELQEGDIILSLDRPLVGGGLKLARLTRDDIPALLLQRVGRFQLNDKVVPDYLYFYLQTNDFIEAITEHDQSLGVPHVSPKQVEQLELPLPPLDKQRAVAARLRTRRSHAVAEVADREVGSHRPTASRLVGSGVSGGGRTNVVGTLRVPNAPHTECAGYNPVTCWEERP